MENYYFLLGVDINAEPQQVFQAYQSKIFKFNFIDDLTNEDINEIKLLKKGLYILTNQELRIKYNNIANFSNNNLNNQYNIPQAQNQDNEETLDTLFNVDNTWMNNLPTFDKNENSKKKSEASFINDRIFSLSNLQSRPGYSADNEIELRKFKQGRTVKEVNVD